MWDGLRNRDGVDRSCLSALWEHGAMEDASSALSLPPPEAHAELTRIARHAKSPQQRWMAQWWAADALALMGEVERAIAEHPPFNATRATFQSERLLSLKVAAKLPPSEADLLALFGPNVTDFGSARLNEVRAAARHALQSVPDLALTELLRSWGEQAPASQFSVYVGSPIRATLPAQIKYRRFSLVEGCENFCRTLAREAENAVRRREGVPLVGEGWVSETELYRQIAAAFPDEQVVHHGSPPWLGRQHLDIYLPSRAVGVEFQGVQHDRPVEFFGGQEAWEATKRRDERKRRLCATHGVRLIYVRPGYDIDSVLDEIRSGQSGP